MRNAFLFFVISLMCTHVAGADPGSAATRATERRLRHVRLELDEIKRWKNGDVSTESLSAAGPLLVVHLFSLDCPPCLEELKHLKRLFQRGTPGTRFAMVLETLDKARIRQFLIDKQDEMPDVDLYISTNRAIRDASHLGTDEVPLTLLIDRRRVIRHAFAGILKHRQDEYVAALSNVRRSLGTQPFSTVPVLAPGRRLQPEELLHIAVPTTPIAPGARLQVAYLYGAGCGECTADLAGRLRRLIQSWSAERDIQFSLLDCGAHDATHDAPAPAAGLAPSLFRACTNPDLADLFRRELRPITLILDDRHVVREAFVGPVESSLGVALRRLQSAARP